MPHRLLHMIYCVYSGSQIYLWVSALVMGILMGYVVGRLWMVFSWGGVGGEEGTPYHGLFFSLDDASFQTVLFMLYIIYWSVGVSLQDASDHRERCPRSSMPWTDMCDVQVSTTRRPLPRTEDWVYVTCYFCYMFKEWYQPWYVDLIIRIKPFRLVFWSITDSW
jgi:hypothetical protein